MTSVAVLMLVEEGKIGLTDPVSRFIPAYAKTTVAVTKAGRQPGHRSREARHHHHATC